jgi:hypothetical protein
MVRVAGISGQLPGRRERRHVKAHAHEIAPVVEEVVRVRQAVTLNVRSARVLGIGPPVIALGEEVVQPAGAPRRPRSGDGDGVFRQVGVGRAENPGAVEGGNIEAGRVCGEAEVCRGRFRSRDDAQVGPDRTGLSRHGADLDLPAVVPHRQRS